MSAPPAPSPVVVQTTTGLFGLIGPVGQPEIALPLSVKLTVPLRLVAPAGAVTVAVNVTC